MHVNSIRLTRRKFLQKGVTFGIGALGFNAVSRLAVAASRDRVVVFQGVGLDSLHPYAYSGAASAASGST